MNVAAITYDSIEQLHSFAQEQKITYTLLRDADSRHVKAYGILNMQYEEGSPAHGVPHPGIMLIDTEGVIRAKFAERGYRERPDFTDVLAGVRSWVEAP